jgi:ABC-type transport system substrate-binding protein
MTVALMLLTLMGVAVAQTPSPTPGAMIGLPQGERLKVAVQLEREQNDPILMSVVYASQYAPVYEALVEEDPWHNFVPMLATDWSMSPDGKTWTFNLRKGVQWHFGWGEFTARDVVHTLQRHVRADSMSVAGQHHAGIVGERGRGDPMAVTFWHATLPGWNPQWLAAYETHYGYDPQRAKALLAEAGYPQGFKATYILTPRPELPELMEVGQVIANYWREIGVDLKLEEREFAWWREKLLKEQLHGMAWTDATVRFEDRDIMRLMYYSKGVAHFFESAFVDQKYEQFIASADPQEQDQLLREAGNYLFEEYASLPLFWLSTEFVANPRVVADYKTSGMLPPRHLEYIKAVK